MDRITHQVRLANWTKIIEQYNNRPTGTSAKQWLSDNGISDKSYYYWLRKIRQEAYASKEKELPAIQSIQERTPAVTFAEIPLPEQQVCLFTQSILFAPAFDRHFTCLASSDTLFPLFRAELFFN